MGWGVGSADLDNDGNPDIFWVTGGIYPEEQEHYASPRLIFRNLGPKSGNARFEELMGMGGPAMEAMHSSRGCAFGDFDNDGDMDILVITTMNPRRC